MALCLSDVHCHSVQALVALHMVVTSFHSVNIKCYSFNVPFNISKYFYTGKLALVIELSQHNFFYGMLVPYISI